MATCPVCQDVPDRLTEIGGGERLDVACPGCGVFVITKMAVDDLDSHPIGMKRAVLSRWIRLACERDQRPEIDQRQCRAILAQPAPPISEQADTLLLWLGDELRGLVNPTA